MKQQKRPFTWRLSVISVIIFSVGLAGLGIFFAIHQTESLGYKLMDQAGLHAGTIRDNCRRQFDRELANTLLRLAYQQRTRPEAPIAFAMPNWIDGLYQWNGTGLTTLADQALPDDLGSVLEAVLTGIEMNMPTRPDSDQPRLIFHELETLDIVVSYMKDVDSFGNAVLYAARIDVATVHRDILLPQLSSEYGLEIVPVEQSSGLWSRTLDGPLRSWAIQPTPKYITEQRSIVTGQVFASFSLTILALVTVLAAMWYLVRFAQRDVDLAELKSSFVANVSHELKTPLALIRLYSETLLSGRITAPQKQQEYYSIITRESTRLTNLINNILDFSRIEAGRKEYTLQPTDVGQVVKETYENYRPELEQLGFENDLKMEEGLRRIDVDSNAISQVLVNLVGNAIKYSGSDKYVGIEVSHDLRGGRHGVLIIVRDRGIGIRPEDRPHLFDGFFRAEDNRVRERTGTGLGLALVKHIVDAHHGSIEVTSRLVKGTAFRVFLPASQAVDESQDADQNQDPVPDDGGSITGA